MRRTKIIATLGPATDDPKILEQLILSGVDLFRMNYSHQDHMSHQVRIQQIRTLSAKLGIETGIIADLQGPKIRLERFKRGRIMLKENDPFILDTQLEAGAGNKERVGVTYKKLAKDVKRGNRLLLDDGRIVLEVEKVKGPEIH